MYNFSQENYGLVKSPENSLIQGNIGQNENLVHNLTISTIAPLFFEWAQYDQRLSHATVARYREALGWVVRDIGDPPVATIHMGHVLTLRKKTVARGCGLGREAAILNSLRALLKFCRIILGLPVIDHRVIKIRNPNKGRQVVYLTKEEVSRLRDSIIPPNTSWQYASLPRLRFRTLVEVLLGTGARIAEALSLDRSRIDFVRKEARVVGKGNKERTLFFTDGAMEWVKRYLSSRNDDLEALFVTHGEPKRLNYDSVKNAFERYCSGAGIKKKVSAHILRHTAATTLLFNGCPIGHIKEVLGHEKLETTCQYYLGIDTRLAKEAHRRFLTYE